MKNGTHGAKTTIRKSIMLRISRKARTIARAAYASIRNAHAMVSYIGYIVNSDSQHFYEKWVRPFVNIKHLKGVIADEDHSHARLQEKTRSHRNTSHLTAIQ